jgi:CheY-like chemotaxis protein/Tfp pilus assembly protein PilZ
MVKHEDLSTIPKRACMEKKIMPEHPRQKSHDVRDALKKPLVLVVDGDPARRFITSIVLQRLDYHVAAVNSAEDALMILSLVRPELILTEIALPSLSGIDLLNRIKTNTRTNAIPVIIYTHLQDPAYRKTCFQAECSGYLADPVDPEQLYAAVQSATEQTPRHFVRLRTSLTVTVGTSGIPGFTVRTCQVSALSENGMFVGIDRPLPYGTVLPFTLHLDEQGADTITLEGRVLYSHQGGEKQARQPGMGVKFTKISDDHRVRLRNFLKEQLMSGVAVPIKTQE